jgi:hypothetical protein
LPPPTPQWYPDYAPPTAATKAHVNRQVMYCGLCRDYSGLRKRKRAAQLPPPLPGLEAHAAYLLHAPCGPIGLKTLQRALRQLELDIVAVRGIPHELIPTLGITGAGTTPPAGGPTTNSPGEKQWNLKNPTATRY